MNKKKISELTLLLLLISTLTFAFGIQPVRASGTIYIRPDGTVEGTDKIQRDGDTYTFIDNISGYEIVVERDNIVVDGAGYTLQARMPFVGMGIYLEDRSNVTIKGLEIKLFELGIKVYSSSNNAISDNHITENSWSGIDLAYSSNNTISGNIVANNLCGIAFSWSSIGWSSNNTISGNIVANNLIGTDLRWASNNTVSSNNVTNNFDGIYLHSLNNVVSGNTITNNEHWGIWIRGTSDNRIFGNNITQNARGIQLSHSSNNTVTGNTVTANSQYGICLVGNCITNEFCHNTIVNNVQQVYIYGTGNPNVWDDGYPSGGNYWSDYEERYPDATEIDDSGIWDTPYAIDESNQDNYPLMEPWTPAPPIPTTIDELKTEIEEMGSQGDIANRGIVRSLIAKLNVSQKLIDKAKMDEARSILEDDFIPQIQNLSGIHITVEAADLLIESAEYILAHL